MQELRQTNSSETGADTNGNIIHLTGAKYKETDEESNRRLWITGIFLIITSITSLIISPHTVYSRKKMILSEGGEMFNLWLRPNVELLAKIYIFNITNKEGFLDGNEKLRLQEVGPYVYRVKVDYKNPQFNDEEGTVSINPELILEWDPKLNNRSDEDFLTLVDLFILSLGGSDDNDPFGMKKSVINAAFNNAPVQSIYEQTVKSFVFGTENTLYSLLSMVAPAYMKYNKVGVLVRALDTNDTTITFFTGQKDFSRAGTIASVNNKTYIPYFNSPCNRLAGFSDGKKFGNHIDKNQKLYVYEKTICRPMPLIPMGPPTVSSQKIPVVPYTLSDEAFDNGQLNPENKCYCINEKCLPYGLIDLSKCFLDYPISMSYPHFYKGDSSLMNNIEGLHPDKNLHTTKLYLNLETGIASSFSLKFQCNFHFGDLSNVDKCEKFSNMVVPLMWIDIGSSELEPTIAFRIYLVLCIFPVLEKVFEVVTFAAGGYFIFKAMRSTKVQYHGQMKLSCKSMAVKISKEEINKEKQIIALNSDTETYLQTLLREEQ